VNAGRAEVHAPCDFKALSALLRAPKRVARLLARLNRINLFFINEIAEINYKLYQ
jgi:hypothetical protein